MDFLTSNGVDDSAALQAALDTTLDNVVLKCIALIKAELLLVRNGIKLTAEPGCGLKLIAPAPVLLLVQNCQGCEVTGLTIDQGGFASRSIQIQDTRNAKLTRNTFINGDGGTAYIFAIRNWNNEYRGNVIPQGSKDAQRGLWIGNGGTAVTPDIEHGAIIEDNYIYGTDATGIGSMGENTVIRRNFVGYTKGAGIAIASNSTYAISNNVLVEDNILPGNFFHGIQSDAWNNSRTRNVTIRKNKVFDNAHSGIYVAHAENWIIADNEGSGNPDGDIVLYDADTILMLDNPGMKIVDQGNHVGGKTRNIRI